MRLDNKMVRLGGFLSFLIVFFPAVSFSQIISSDLPKREGIKLGDIVLHSSFKSGFQYDSNIFLADKDEKSDLRADMVTLIDPGIGLEIPLGDNRFSFDYDAAYNRFEHHRKLDHIDHTAKGLGEINLTDYLITIRDTFRRVTDRPSTENTSRIKRELNNFRVGVATQRNRLGFDVGYSNNLEKYLTNDPITTNLTYRDKTVTTHIVDATVSYRFLPKTSVVFENDVGFLRYHTGVNPDSYYIENLIGLVGNLSPNLKINLRGGYKSHHYAKSNVVDNENFSGLVARGGLDYIFAKKNKISLNVERSNYESTYKNLNYYTLNLIGLNLSRAFTNKITGRAFGSYQINEYPKETTEVQSTTSTKTAKRKDKLSSIGLGVRYDIRKWLSVDLAYECLNKQSNFHDFEYIDHIGTFRITAGF
jgi:hypothetical protein